MSARTTGILWVRPPASAGIGPEIDVLGVPLARRVALAAERAGFSRIVFADAPGIAPSISGTRAEAVGGEGPPPVPAGPARLVILPFGALPTAAWLRAVLAAPESEGGWRDLGGAPGLIELQTAADLPAAESRLLQSLIKDTEGFFSRHINRRISLAVTRRLARTRMTPNSMTAVSVGIGLASAGFFTSGEARFQFAGAMLFLLHSILDGCDGELARLKFQESRLGGVLDFWGDNVVHCAVFACLAAGWSRDAADPRPAIAGLLAIAGTLLSAGFVARYALGSAADGPQFTSVTRRARTRLSRIADMLARRDFIYLVVLLSAFGKARWFLALAAVGAPVFFLTLLAIEASGRRLGREIP